MTADIVKIISYTLSRVVPIYTRSIHTPIFCACRMHLDDDDDDKHKKKSDTKLKVIETIAMSSTLEWESLL